MKKGKSNASAVYCRAALNQSSEARFHPGFVSYCAESAFTWSETSGESVVYLWDSKPQWNLALEGWFQAVTETETGKQIDFQKG